MKYCFCVCQKEACIFMGPKLGDMSPTRSRTVGVFQV